MSALDRNIFELQPLEVRKLLASVSVDGSHILQINSLSSPSTVVVNKISNGNIVVTINGVATGPQLSLGTGSGQFNQVNILGSGGSDNILINGNFSYSSATVQGGSGNDTITTGQGNDTVSGNGGNDVIDGGGGNDLMAGQDGMDQVNYSSRTAALRISLNGAADDGTASTEFDNVQVEEVLGGSGNDTFSGSSADDFFYGNGGADSMTGNGGNDELTGGSGQDKIFGNDGDDFLQAQNNDQDTVNGGSNANGTADFDLANIDGLDVASGLLQANSTGTTSTPLLGLGGNTGPRILVGGNAADLDTTYATGGKLSDDPGFTPRGAAVDSQGRLVVVGDTFQDNGLGYGYDFVITRYDANGNLDTSFGNNGFTTVDFSDVGGTGYGNENDLATGVAIAPGDNILVFGSHDEGTGYGSDSAIARLTPTGALDGTFGEGGRVVQPANAFITDEIDDVAVQSNGDIVAVGTEFPEGSATFVYRLHDNGSPDTTFNDEAGINVLPLGNGVAVALQSFVTDEGAQRIVVGGSDDGTFAMARLGADGTLDASFGDGGFVFQDESGGNNQSRLQDIAVDANNNIITVGDASNFSFLNLAPPAPGTTHAVLAKFNPAGVLVDDVAHDSPDTESGFASFHAVTIDGNGRYVAVGEQDGDFLVARFNSDTSPDTTFAGGGESFTTTDFGSGFFDRAFAVRVGSGGKILAAGSSDTPSENTIVAAARYKGVTGSLDNPPGSGEGDVTNVEELLNYQDLHQQPPPPELQEVFDRISDSAKFIILSQPDDNGIVRINLGDTDDTVNITIKEAGKDPKPTKGDHKIYVVNINGTVLSYDNNTTKQIQINTGGGNDSVNVSGDVKVQLLVDGGEGNDNLNGGKGNDILLGGPGNDTINGREGKDIAIGGGGQDNLTGDQEEDILIGGTTAHDADPVALTAISSEWSSKDNFNTRVFFIRNGGGNNGTFTFHGGSLATVFDDNATDFIKSAGGKDWIFGRTTGANADVISGFGGGDVLDVI